MNTPPKTTSLPVDPEMIADGIAEYVAPIVGTMGPGGQNVAVAQYINDAPIGVLVTQDGTTLATKQNRSDAPTDALVSSVLGEASHRQLQSVGDGTTTTLVLIKAFYTLFHCTAQVKGTTRAAMIYLTRLLAAARIMWPKLINTNWLDGDDREKTLLGLSMVATHGDESLASLIAEAQEHVGKDGRIMVDLPGTGGDEESHLESDILKIGRGMILNTKLAYRQLKTDGEGSKIGFKTEEGFLTVITNGPATVSDDMTKVLAQYNSLIVSGMIAKGTPIVMFATKVTPEVANAAFMNSEQKNGRGSGAPPICLVQLEGFYANEEWQGLIEDIHSIAGGFLFGPGKGADLRFADNVAHNLKKREQGTIFGFIEGGIEVNTTGTIITFAEGKEQEKVAKLADELRDQAGIELKGNEGDATISRFLLGRATRLQGKTARIILRTGPQIDRRRRYDLADDAIRTLGAAYRSGIAIGQGVSLSNLGISVVSAIQEQYGDAYVSPGLEEATRIAFSTVQATVLQNMGISIEKYNEMVSLASHEAPEKNILAYNDDGDGYELISSKENFIYDGADVGITAVEISLQSAMLLGNTGHMIIVKS